MTTKREVIHTWTCDVCGYQTAVDDSGSGYPRGWTQVAWATIAAQLGNVAARHLCTDCTGRMSDLLEAGGS